MLYTPQEVLDKMLEFAQEIKLSQGIDAVFYREDYQDYQIILDENYHCEIREKLIEIFMKDPKHDDTRREIIFLLRHPNAYEEWEDTPMPPSAGGGDIVLE